MQVLLHEGQGPKKFRNLFKVKHINTQVERAGDSGPSAGARVITDRGGQAGSLDRSDGRVKFLARCLPDPRCGEMWVGSKTVRGVQAGTLARCDCDCSLSTGALAHCLPPTRNMVKFGVVRGPSSDHSGLGSTPKL